MNSIIILFLLIGSAVEWSDAKDFLGTGQLDCEGKDGGNYTLLVKYVTDEQCSLGSKVDDTNDYLIACQKNGEKVLNTLAVLAESNYPAGAYYQTERLYLALSGNLEGNFVYLKEIGLLEAYLKKCSSVLGYSYISTKSQVILIADKLDPNILISPTGAFEPFKKCATTICKGNTVYV